MSSDTASSTARGDDAAQIHAKWQSARRRHGACGDVDRAGLVTSISAGFGRGSTATLDVATAAATFGAAHAIAGQTLNALVEELDLLEEIWLDHIFDREQSDVSVTADARTSARRLHGLASTARRSAIAAFAHASASATKKQIRLARHDIANAIGAVRNAVLLMDEATDATRDHLRGIAKRNSFTAETLLRLHLSDSTVLTTALGWQDVALSELSESLEPGQNATNQLRGATSVGALSAIVGTLRAAYDDGDMPTTERVSVSIVPNGAGAGLLTVHAPTHADRGDDPRAVDAIRQLSHALGVTLEEGSTLTQLRLIFSLSAGDQRHDLGGASQGHHTDAVRL